MPTFTQVLLIAALLANISIGVSGLLANRFRWANRIFFCLTVSIDLWLACLLGSAFTRRPETFRHWLHWSHALSVALFTLCDFVRIAIVARHTSLRPYLRDAGILLVFCPLAIALCFTPWLIDHVGARDGSLYPVYGPGILLYNALCFAILGVSAFRGFRNLRAAKGAERIELQSLYIPVLPVAVVGLAISALAQTLVRTNLTLAMLPLIAIILDACIAYGIVTRRLLGVGYLVRRLLAYALLVVFLILVYVAVWFVFHKVLEALRIEEIFLCYLLAAVALALTVVPVRGWFQRLALRLFVNLNRLDETREVQAGLAITRAVSTLDQLLARFAAWVLKASGTEQCSIFLLEEERYVRHYPPGDSGTAVQALTRQSPLVQVMAATRAPMAYYTLERLPPHPPRAGMQATMRELGADLAAGIYTNGEMHGLLLLGPRLSGRVYDRNEQDMLQLICNQLGVAIDNARLYTQLQNHVIYTQAMLESLTCGVIGVDSDGLVNVFNREAQRITGLPGGAIIGRPAHQLPPLLRDALQSVLRGEEPICDRTDMLLRDGQHVPVRLSASIFHGHSSSSPSALLVFNDISLLIHQEEQIRRTDRMASIGVLSAGMAHEIKNPLVSIKTFAQLLPARYDDPEFRAMFSGLVDQEIDRIDQTVNRLLRFSRASEPNLHVLRLHEFLEETLRLIEVQLKGRNLSLVRRFAAHEDTIRGDANQLNQAFVNFFLNAIEAMSPGGTLTVSTACLIPHAQYAQNHLTEKGRTYIRVAIADTGCGIRPENLGRIFDPFFTTRPDGTGMGLAVAHGILKEHRALIEVQSEVGQGTTISVLLPLATETPQAERTT